MKKTFLLTVALVCAGTQVGWAQETQEAISYIERYWNGSQVVEETKSCTAYTLITSETTELTLGWYVVKGEVTFSSLVSTVGAEGGDINIILCDGARLTTNLGFNVGLTRGDGRNAHRIHVYGQANDTGMWIARTGTEGNNMRMGIGSSDGTCEYYQHGGIVEATGRDGIRKTTNGYYSTYFHSGVGASKFYMYGGTLSATGGENGPGIGKDHYNCNYRTAFYIYGGTVNAQGGKYAAGISCDSDLGIGNINIYGGTVNATGGAYGAGIGGGDNFKQYNPVYIYGGTVNAQGGTDAAGIGGGEDGDGGVVRIYGGTVYAHGNDNGAGIGGGENGAGGNISINGGEVTALAGSEDGTGHRAIGPGNGSEKYSQLNIGGNMMVEAGASGGWSLYPAADRVGACWYHVNAHILPCTHSKTTYTIDGDMHTKHCTYCYTTLGAEAHTFLDHVCQYCGKKEESNEDLWSVTLYRASATGSTSYADHVTMMVVKGQPFTIPAVSATEGLTLMGYTTSWNTGDGIEMKDNETIIPVGTEITPEADMTYYPRYRYRYVPTWTWNDADATATLSITLSALNEVAVNVSNINYVTDGEVKTATATYNHGEATYIFTDTYSLPVDETITLLDNASNEETLSNYRGKKVKTLILSGRTLSEDGNWNTLCLPFDLSQEELITYFGSCELKVLGSTSFNSAKGELTLNFTDASSIVAGKPYLIKWTSGSGRSNPTFSNVTINTDNNAVTTDDVEFCGTYSLLSLMGGDKTILYLGDNNTLYYPSDDMTVGSCRAVFQLKGITAGNLTSQARSFVLNFGEEDSTQGVTTPLSYQSGVESEAFYSLDCRRLSGKPTTKGLYIYNGKKVAIK